MKKAPFLSATLVAAIALLCAPAHAISIGSFEGGTLEAGWELDETASNPGAPAGWSSVNTGAPKATDGDYALQVDVGNKTGYYNVGKNYFNYAAMQANTTLEFDIYVESLPVGGWAQSFAAVNSETGPFTLSPNLDLSVGTNHFSWDYVAAGANLAGAWGGVHLGINDSDTTSLGNIWYDNIQLTGAAPYKSSWENSDDGWKLYDGTGITPTNAAGGAPAGAITDGDYALKIDVGNETAWTQHVQLNTATDGADALIAMKENNTVEFDLFIEAGEILPEKNTAIGLVLNQAGGFMASYATLDFNDTGSTYHFKWNYGDEALYDENTSWAQFRLQTVADDAANGADPISEFYVDNFRFSTTTLSPGDFDADNDVDGADFLAWQRDTNVGNLADWQANYGSGAASAATSAVPEPASALLCMVGGLLAFARRKR